MGSLLRTKETQELYDKVIAEGLLKEGCVLCKAPSKEEFKYWRVIENKFPYDRIAQVHDMLIPKRCVKEEAFTQEEIEEFKEIRKSYVEDNYGYVIEPTFKNKSVPEHYHLHLILGKEIS